MHKLMLFAGLLLLAIAAMLVNPPVSVRAAGCGYKPYKPYTPYGCKDMVAECVCDAKGDNCQWVWKCIPQ